MSALSIEALASSLQQLVKGGLTDASVAVRQKIISTCKDIIFALQTPNQHVLQLSFDGMNLVALRTAMRLNVLDVLPEQGRLTLDELAERTGAQKSMLERLLRVLVGSRFFSFDSEKRYGHTHISLDYRMSGSACYWFKGVLYQPVMEALIRYPLDYLDSYPTLAEPDDTKNNPLVYNWNKMGENIWEVFPRDHPDQMADFQRGMAVIGEQLPITGFYDFSKLLEGDDGQRPLIVDVGGGAGACLIAIVKAHPEIHPERLVLQDMAVVLEHAKSTPDLPKGVQLMPHDFWSEQPVKGAKAYYLRWILHDYSDVAATEILKKIVPAMAPDSKVIINDAVIPERLDEGSMYAGAMDLFMFAIGGKERTKAFFEQIFADAGLKILGIYPAPGTVVCTIEAGLAEAFNGRIHV